MPLETPVKWYKPFNREERIWLAVIVVWGIVMFFMMPLGHLAKQNVSSETYRTTPEEFRALTNRFVEKYQRRDANNKKVFKKGLPIVDPPVPEAGGKTDVFLLAEAWRFTPILVLKKNRTYRIHLSSADFQHGFSLQPQNLNFQILPYYDFVITMQPNESGTFHLICNEYCMYIDEKRGHDTMVGQIIVKD